MDIKFSKDSDENKQQAGVEDKGKQNLLLVVLLILVGGFGYVYFFTDLIKPQQDQKPPPPPSPQVVKKPLPPSDGQPAKAASPPVPATPAPATAAAAKPVAAPAPLKTAGEPKKADAAKPAVEAKKADAAKAAEKKPSPAVVKADEKKPVLAEKKPAAAPDKKAPPVAAMESKAAATRKPLEKKTDAAVTAKKAVKKPTQNGAAIPAKAVKTSSGWTVLVGSYVLEEALASDLVRVRKAGLEASIVPGVQKKTRMNRLLLAEFADREAARAQLDKLKRYTSDAFIIDSAGKHLVYAGSYMLDARAASEKERLAAAGFKLTIRRVDVSIASKSLTAGVFSDRKAADEALRKLKAAGITSAALHQ